MYLASLGDEIKVWDGFSLNLTEQFFTSADNVKDFCWNHDGTLLSSSCKATSTVDVKLISNGKRANSHSFQLPSPCCCVDFASRYLLAGCEDGALHILDLQTSKIHKSFTGNKYPINVARWNWNDQNIAFGCHTGQIVIYNVITGQSSSPFKPSSSQSISQLRYNPYRKSSLASTAEDGVISFWDTNTRSLVHAFKSEHQAPATDHAFSPVNDQLMVSVGLDKRLVLYDVQGKKSIKTIVADYPLTSLDMQDGCMVAVGTSRGKILMYDLRKAGVPVVTIPAHKTSVKRISFNRKEIASPGASQPKEVFPSSYSDQLTDSVHDSSSNNNTDKSNNNFSNGPALPSFLRDESSSYLSHNNNNSGSFNQMSPVISGHDHLTSLAFLNSASSVTGVSSLYSFLQNESSNVNENSEAENTGGYLMEMNNSKHTAQDSGAGLHPAARENQTKSPVVSDSTRTPPRRLPQPSVGQLAYKGSLNSSPYIDDVAGGEPACRNTSPPTARTSDRSSRTDSCTTIGATSPKHWTDEAVFHHSSKNTHKTFPEKADSGALLPSQSHQSSLSSSPPDVYQLLGQMKKELQDLKVEVKAVIKAELKQPQTTNRNQVTVQSNEEDQGEMNPQLFKEEYLRKLIRDEMEEMMEQSRRDFLGIKSEMHRLHVQMWWWLDHRFSEQLYNPVLVEQMKKLADEVKRLRCGFRS